MACDFHHMCVLEVRQPYQSLDGDHLRFESIDGHACADLRVGRHNRGAKHSLVTNARFPNRVLFTKVYNYIGLHMMLI